MIPKRTWAELSRRGLSCFLAVVMICSVTLAMAGCSKKQEPPESANPTTPETSLEAEKEILEQTKKQLAELIAQNQELLNQMLSTKEEIQEMLDEAQRRKDEIADKIGFNDYNYFCRVFKKEVGMPAKQYRKQDGII